MQSGITASQSLHEAFASFSSDQAQFCLPVTIEGEALVPLDPIHFSGLHHEFASSLPALGRYLQPKTPIYLLVRPSSSSTEPLTAITYVPSTAPVRAKTLFASTRQSLTRTLGLDNFGDSVFVTDAFEVTDPAEWAARARAKQPPQYQEDQDQPDQNDEGHNETLLSAQERELLRVRRAEEQERHGTSGLQLSGRSLPGSGGNDSNTKDSSGLTVQVTDEAGAALASIADGELVQLGLDPAGNTLVLLLKASLAPGQVQAKVPTDRPTYNLYRYAGAGTVLFIYVCPGGSKVKDRMVYASSLRGVIDRAKAEGIQVSKRLELDADDITADRLAEEAGVQIHNTASTTSKASASEGGASSGLGFSRPKRPGRR